MRDTSRQVRGACALDCPDTCGWIVTVEHGRALKLQGDAAHPFTRGVLCAVNATVDERDADMGGGAVFHDNRVEIERR